MNTEQNQYPVTVTIGQNGYTTNVRAGEHDIISDEPESAGGKDLGPSPYDLLLSSLGACTAMTLKMYANLKKWDLQEVVVGLKHSKDYHSDCKDCEDKGAKIDMIDRVISIKGDLDEKQKERLLKIANKCPVHRTLHNEILVKTEML